MVYRKGEFQLSRLDHEYPFHVARHSPYGQVLDYIEVNAFRQTFGGAPRTYSVGECAIYHHIFCFKDAQHAKAFLERFGGFPIGASPKARKELLAGLRADHSTTVGAGRSR